MNNEASQPLCFNPRDVLYNLNSLLRALVDTIFVRNKLEVDFLNELPSKISNKILRMLDTKSLGYAARVSKKWKIICESELKQRKIQYDAKIQETAYCEQLWELLMYNIEKTYGQRFPF